MIGQTIPANSQALYLAFLAVITSKERIKLKSSIPPTHLNESPLQTGGHLLSNLNHHPTRSLAAGHSHSYCCLRTIPSAFPPSHMATTSRNVGGANVNSAVRGGRTNNDNNPQISPQLSPTFLERHDHTPMNLGDVQVMTTQNGTRRRAESSPAPPTTTPGTAATPASARTSSEKIAIRIVPAMDSFTRLPLRFDPIDRKVDEGEVLVVGRHTDRLVTEHPTAIVFRSKVVSRNHAKMWCTGGQWYLQDVGSSSGTFLNHIRLSPPNVESTPYSLKDGDIVQLGIDFRVCTLY